MRLHCQQDNGRPCSKLEEKKRSRREGESWVDQGLELGLLRDREDMTTWVTHYPLLGAFPFITKSQESQACREGRQSKENRAGRLRLAASGDCTDGSKISMLGVAEVQYSTWVMHGQHQRQRLGPSRCSWHVLATCYHGYIAAWMRSTSVSPPRCLSCSYLDIRYLISCLPVLRFNRPAWA